MKCCCSCKIEKSFNDFYKDKNSKDGFGRCCKNCSKEYNIIWKNNNPDYNKNYNLKNKESISETFKKWYNNNKDYVLEKTSNYRYENREAIRKKDREYSKTTKRKNYVNEMSRKKQKTDPDYRFRGRIMRHIKGVQNRKEFIEIWGDVKSVYEMYGIKYHIDHKIPKNWFNHNTPSIIVNNINNLQIIDATYNLSKQDMWADSVCLEYLNIVKPYIKKKYINHLICNSK